MLQKPTGVIPKGSPEQGLVRLRPAVNRFGFDVSSNISNVICAELGAKSRHAVLAIGHLISDGFFMAIVVVGEISLEIVLLERALTVNDVAASDVAGRATGMFPLAVLTLSLN